MAVRWRVRWCVIWLLGAWCLLSLESRAGGQAAAAPPVLASTGPAGTTTLVQSNGGWRLNRNGSRYLIRGVGGNGSYELLARLGGNSIRTWGLDGLDRILDAAHRQGHSVCVGIWLGHERHGFNYNDADQVAKQADMVREAILRYKDHPAVLLWGLGNEMEGYEKGDNAAIWSAINNLASMARRLDPAHPTMTVVAELGGDRVKNLHRLCPDIDIVGINSYAGAATIPRRYRDAGGTKPYIVTEFGPPGSWEVEKNSWGAALEPTSSEKAEAYRRSHVALAADQELCLGSYAFLWGHKQEATATWFGMLLPDGSRLAACDALAQAWTGKPVSNRCPVIRGLDLEGPAEFEPRAMATVKLRAEDPDGDPLQVEWRLQADWGLQGVGGDAEESPPFYPEAILRGDLQGAEFKMPDGGGGYRLFAYVRDAHGGAAVANIPLRGKGPVTPPPARVAQLPLILYDEAGREGPPYVPSGWIGNHKALKYDEAWADKPHSGTTCARIAYEATDQWAGICWQHPANDWGDRPGGWNLSGAKRLSVWLRGETGTERVNLEFGILGPDKKFPDTAQVKRENLMLSQQWQQFTIDLTEKRLDLSRIKTGLLLVVAATGQPVTIYLDDARFE